MQRYIEQTQNLIINMDDDDKLIYNDDSATLSWLGFGMLAVFNPLGLKKLNAMNAIDISFIFCRKRD